ncbi:MAG: hypothetical protein CMM25_05300 [Rhodospirillaceae bacterium]|nr:hypothetical protein [Rhodospirillaceae bacterium]
MNTVWDNVEYFEGLIAEYAGSKYAVAVDSCTNALFLSIQLSETTTEPISVPKRTYISVPMQIAHCGYKLQFNSLEWSGSYKLDPLPVVDSAQRFTENMYVADTLYCLSFHSKKILSIGRGGMILTDDRSARDWLRRSRYDGRESIYYNDMKYNNVPTLGWHMYMTPEEAVRGIEQFYKTPAVNADSGCSNDYGVDLSLLDCFNDYII